MSEPVKVPENYQYLRSNQIAELEQEAKALDERLIQPALGADKGEMRKRRRRIQEMLDTQQAPDLSPSERDAWAKEAKRLEEQFVPSMLSGEIMRKNPPGAVDRNIAWNRKYSRIAARWKNIQRALSKGDDSPDIANVERLRPWRTPQDLSISGAQIPGKAFFGTNPSPQYLENYDRVFPDPKNGDPEQEKEGSSEAESSSSGKIRMACGALKDRRGQKTHEKYCSECQRILSDSSESSSLNG